MEVSEKEKEAIKKSLRENVKDLKRSLKGISKSSVDLVKSWKLGEKIKMGVKAGSKSRIIKEEQVLESWSILIESGKGKANEIFEATEAFIKESKAPFLKIEKRKMSAGAG